MKNLPLIALILFGLGVWVFLTWAAGYFWVDFRMKIGTLRFIGVLILLSALVMVIVFLATPK